jgi:hypothetical protein
MSDDWKALDWNASPTMARITSKDARLAIHKKALRAAIESLKRNKEIIIRTEGAEDPPVEPVQEIAERLAVEWLDQQAAQGFRGRTYRELADHLTASGQAALTTLQAMGYDPSDIAERAARGDEEAESVFAEAGFSPVEIAHLKTIPEEGRAGYGDLSKRLGVDPELSAIASRLPGDRRTTSALQSAVVESLAKMRPEDLHSAGIPAHARTSLLGSLVRLDDGAGLVAAEQAGAIDANTVSEGMLAVHERARAEDAERAKSPDDPRSWSPEKLDAYLNEFGRQQDEAAVAAANVDDLPTVREMKADLAKWAKEDEAKAEAATKASFAHFFPVND